MPHHHAPSTHAPSAHAPTAVPASGHTFVVGQDHAGRWLAVETHGLGGGLFASKAAAVHYALFEADGRANAVVLAVGPVSLGFAPAPHHAPAR